MLAVTALSACILLDGGPLDACHLAGACTTCSSVGSNYRPYGTWGCKAFGVPVIQGGLCLPLKSVKQRVFTVEDWRRAHGVFARDLRALKRKGYTGACAEMQAGRRTFQVIKVQAFRRLGLAKCHTMQEIMDMF